MWTNQNVKCGVDYSLVLLIMYQDNVSVYDSYDRIYGGIEKKNPRLVHIIKIIADSEWLQAHFLKTASSPLL